MSTKRFRLTKTAKIVIFVLIIALLGGGVFAGLKTGLVKTNSKSDQKVETSSNSVDSNVDTSNNGECFDESFVFPSPEDESKTLANIGMVLPYVETAEDKDKSDRSRVFIHFDNDDVYELKMDKLNKEQLGKCSNFYSTEKQ